MSLIIRPKRWTAKPSLGASLDWGHPLANGLRMAVLFNEGGGYTITDIAQNNPALVTSTGLAWATGPKGMGLNSAGSGGRVESANLTHVNATDLSVFSIQTATNSGFQCMIDSDDAVTRVFQYRLNSGTQEFIRFNTGGSAFVATGSAVSAAQLAGGFSMAATSQGSAMKLYLEGVQAGAGATITGTPKPLTQFVQLFKGRSSSPFPMIGSIYVAYVWDRALSPSEVQQLHADPYAMVAPQGHRRIFSRFQAAGAGVQQPQFFVV